MLIIEKLGNYKSYLEIYYSFLSSNNNLYDHLLISLDNDTKKVYVEEVDNKKLSTNFDNLIKKKITKFIKTKDKFCFGRVYTAELLKNYKQSEKILYDTIQID